jgi:hypothetical protein
VTIAAGGKSLEILGADLAGQPRRPSAAAIAPEAEPARHRARLG